MKKLMRDALIFVGGFAAGVATMHFLMRDTYKKQADVLVEDARNHFKQREQELDMTIEQRSNEKAYDLVSGPYVLNAIAECFEKVTACLMDLIEEVKRQPLKMILQKLRPDYKDKCKIRWLDIPNKVMQGRIRRFC